jgi:hypothetical protein
MQTVFTWKVHYYLLSRTLVIERQTWTVRYYSSLHCRGSMVWHPITNEFDNIVNTCFGASNVLNFAQKKPVN